MYNELPDSVKQELESNYNLVFKESVNSDMKGKAKEISEQMIPIANTALPELPPWSQLDPLSLLALPDDMREQILKTYASKEDVQVSKSPQRTPTNQRIRPPVLYAKTLKSSKSRGDGNNRTRTITQMFQSIPSPSSRSNASFNHSGFSLSMNNDTPTTRNSMNSRIQSVFQLQDEIEDEEEDLPFDAEVWDELPQEMKNELLEERRRLKRRQAQQIIEKEHLASRDSAQKVDLKQYTKEPSLQGMTDVNEIRSLLNEWVFSYKEKPEPEDISTISDYLIELVHYADLEKVQLLVVYLMYLLQDSSSIDWKQFTSQIQERISNTVKSIYGCPLKFLHE